MNSPFRLKTPLDTTLISPRILLINTCGFLVASLSATLLDAQLMTHVLFGRARNYPLGCSIAFFTPMFPLATYILMRLASSWKRGKIHAAWLSNLAALLFLGNFRPEFPHVGFCLDIAGYSLLAFLTVFLQDPTPLPEFDPKDRASIQHLEDSIKESRSVLFIAGTSYLVLAIYWLQLLWTIAGLTVHSDSEKWIFGTTMSVKVVIFSLFVGIGPLTTLFRNLRRRQEQLLNS
jgi:hypothetical protein